MLTHPDKPAPKIIRPPRPPQSSTPTDVVMAAMDNIPKKEVKAHSKEQIPLEVYYEDSSKNYLTPDAKGDYINLNEASLKRWLKGHGLSDYKGDGRPSQIDDELTRIQKDLRIAYAGSLAGYTKGLHEVNGRNFLVVDSPTIIRPEPGEWPIIEGLLRGMLVHDDHDQSPHFFGWLKRRVEALNRRERLPGQALVLAGPRGCGKSLTQREIITPLVGGRSANPYKWMSSDTGFNGDCGAAEHLMIDDEVAKFDHRSRHNFGAQIKQVTVGSMQRVEGKYQNAFNAPLIQALTISLNDEPENLHVLPPIDESLADKLIILKVGKAEMPMRTNTPEQMKKFRDKLQTELPHFVHFLQQYEIPKDLISDRFGVTHFHHPDLREAVEELEPWVRFLELIDNFYSHITQPVEITSVSLYNELTAFDTSVAPAARKLLYFDNACGTYLKRIHDHKPERVTFRKTNKGKIWTICPPPQEETTTSATEN